MAFNFQKDPLENLLDRLDEARSLEVGEAGAMALATTTKDGLPELRTVLFKGLVRGGISFYTSYLSPKAQELKENPRCGALFFWPLLAQQVRISGLAQKLTRQEAESYFSTRPRLSQIGAWASVQSQEIPGFDFLKEKVAYFEKKFSNGEVPCPESWGGFCIIPYRMEFWFGRDGRLHERFVYERTTVQEEWKRKLVAP